MFDQSGVHVGTDYGHLSRDSFPFFGNLADIYLPSDFRLFAGRLSVRDDADACVTSRSYRALHRNRSVWDVPQQRGAHRYING